MDSKDSKSKDKKLSIKEKWRMSPRYLRWINFKNSIYWYALGLVILLVSLLIISMLLTGKNPTLQNVFVAIFTGAISSAFVTILLQVKQDRLENEKKRSILFDAGYFIKLFNDRYYKLEKDPHYTWLEKYQRVEESVRFLADIYTNQAQLFDTIEMNFLRDLRNNYRFITRLIDAPHKNVKIKKDMNDEIGKLLQKISANVGCLKIYWEYMELIPKD